MCQGRTMSDDIKGDRDLRLELRFKNARLWHAVYDKWNSVAAFCAAFKRENRAFSVGRLITLKVSPLNKITNNPTRTAEWLCDVLGFDFGELFPPYLYDDQLPSIRIAEAYGEEILSLSDPTVKKMLVADTCIDEDFELKDQVEKVLKLLTQREESVIRKRFLEGFTHRQIADDMDVSHERVRQIEVKALRKLRHSSIGKELKGFWG